MNARYVDLPYPVLAHALRCPELWPEKRGRALTIDPRPVDRVTHQLCEGPHFFVLPLRKSLGTTNNLVVCVHIIELDESALDREVTELLDVKPESVVQTAMNDYARRVLEKVSQ